MKAFAVSLELRWIVDGSIHVMWACRYEHTAFCAGRASLKCTGVNPFRFCSVVEGSMQHAGAQAQMLGLGIDGN